MTPAMKTTRRAQHDILPPTYASGYRSAVLPPMSRAEEVEAFTALAAGDESQREVQNQLRPKSWETWFAACSSGPRARSSPTGSTKTTGPPGEGLPTGKLGRVPAIEICVPTAELARASPAGGPPPEPDTNHQRNAVHPTRRA